MERVALTYIYYHLVKQISCCMTQRAQPGALRSPSGVACDWGGRGIYMCVYTLMADSLCVAETNTTLKNSYPPIKKTVLFILYVFIIFFKWDENGVIWTSENLRI